MKYRITAHHTRSCDILLPASKSISNRALIIGALAGSSQPIDNIAQCDDTTTLIKALSSLNDTIDIGAAGTAMRFLTAYMAMCEGRNVTLTGSQRMQQRPIAPLVDALRQMGAEITYLANEGFPPLHIQGRTLHGGKVTMPGNVSSQFISAMLLIAPYMQHGLHISLQGDILSLPYIDMTIAMMQQFGAHVSRNKCEIEVLPSCYKPMPYTIEPDFSAASYWYEIAAIARNSYRLPRLSMHSLQGDAMIAQYATMWGIKSAFDLQGVTISPTESSLPSQPLRLNLMNEPDLAQTIIMTCALRGQHFCIEGIGNLRIKESNRIDTLIGEAAKLGYRFTQPHPDAIAWQGERCEITQPIIIDTHNDHRIAMAFAPAALCFNEIWIDNPDVVTKSYPSYWSDLEKAGFTITPHTS